MGERGVKGEADWLRSAGNQVMDAMLDDFLRLDQEGIGLTLSRQELDRLLAEPPPEAGADFGHVLADIRTKVIRNSYRPSHPRFLAFIPGAPTFVSILGDCLASNANLFAGVWKEASGAAQVEVVVLDWFKQILEFPAQAMGLLTSGGSEANLTAFVVARESLSYDERARSVLYASDQRHWSIDRAAKIVGMRPEQVRPLLSDAGFRLTINSLQSAVAEDKRAGRIPWLVVANAGTTNTGSIDPLAELADFCRRHGLWLHVDAAYGWPMTLTAQGRTLLQGIRQADSITLDPHKWFAQPFEAGCLLVRRGELLGRTFMMRPEYMQDVIPNENEINFCDLGLALTRRFRALKIWFSIKVLGLAWFRRLIEHGIALAEYAQGLLEQTGRFEITSGRKLSVVCFRYMPKRRRAAQQIDALQLEIAEELLRTGQGFVSTTRLNGQSTLRICFVNWRTAAADVEQVVGLLRDIADRLDRA
jgi:glutamate/tyrosine decarboxylase-like PLP-dependent enzyme